MNARLLVAAGSLAAILSLVASASFGCASSSSAPAGSAGQAGSSAGSGGASAGAAGAGGLGGVVYGAGGFSTTGGSAGGTIETCGGYFVETDGTQTECEACGATQCCDQASACEEDPDCAPCIAGSPTSSCMSVGTPIAPWKALLDCLGTAGVSSSNGPCATACAKSNTSLCNAVTNAGCDDGAACDLDAQGVARCLGAGPGALCAACDATKSIFCGPTLHCLSTGACARFCCEDADCGSGRCVSWPLGGGALGVCIAGVEGETAVCDAPADAASGGGCVP
jgi:hypothetical protein